MIKNDYPNTVQYIEFKRTIPTFIMVDVEVIESSYDVPNSVLVYKAKVTLESTYSKEKETKVEERTVFMPLTKKYCDDLEAKILKHLAV